MRLSFIHTADKLESWVKLSTLKEIPFCGHLPFWSAGRFHHRGHPISIETLGFAKVNNVENDSLKKKEGEVYQKTVLCKLLLPDN